MPNGTGESWLTIVNRAIRDYGVPTIMALALLWMLYQLIQPVSGALVQNLDESTQVQRSIQNTLDEVGQAIRDVARVSKQSEAFMREVREDHKRCCEAQKEQLEALRTLLERPYTPGGQ